MSHDPTLTFDSTQPPTAVGSNVQLVEPTNLAIGETLSRQETRTDNPTPQKKGAKFWLIFAALMMSTFLSALDLTSVSVTLPTIISDLHGQEFVWVGSAYTLGSTAFLPMSGGLAQIFGRRPVMLASLVFFALGSGISGGAKDMTMLIAGRAIQGIGGGGILSLTEIIVADLVPLHERGAFMGLIGAVWAVASAVGPPIGGAFAQSSWRWLFYLNLPLCAIAFGLVFAFLNLKTPKDNFSSKIKRIDWFGNILVIAASSVAIIALTWGGVKYPWSSYKVLVPLILGLVGLGAFFAYEANIPREPLVPWTLVGNRTSLSGYIAVFLHGIASTAVIYYLPIYFQSVKSQSPVNSGVALFGTAFTIAPAAIAVGISVTRTGVYRPQNALGWMISMVGIGLMALFKTNTPSHQWIGFQIIEGIGIGILFPSPTFPILAALPVEETAHALALFAFVRTFAQTWGIAIGSTILTNELGNRLPTEFLAQFPEGADLAFAAIPQIPGLPEPMRGLVKDAFATSLRLIWLVMVGVCGLGLLSVLLMKEIKMHEATDENWGMEDKKEALSSKDEEKATETVASAQVIS